MEGGDSAHPTVRVGALLEQKAGEGFPAAHDGERQGVGAVGARSVDVDTGGHQRLTHDEVAVARGEHQRCEPLRRRDARVGPLLEQQPGDLAMRCGERPHQRGAAGHVRRRVHVGARVNERLHDVEVSRAGGGHQRRQPARLRGVRDGARRQQPFDHCKAGVFRGALERRHAVVVGGVDTGACANEQVDRFQVVPVGRPQQRGRTVGPGRVDVSARGHQRSDGPEVLVRGGDHQSVVLAGRGCGGDRNHK